MQRNRISRSRQTGLTPPPRPSLQLAFAFLFSPSPETAHKAQAPKEELPPSSPKSKQGDPELVTLWQQLVAAYFPHLQHLNDYQIIWSKRPQRRVLASCCPRKKRVIVASELNYPRWHEMLPPLLFHELCHAVIGEDGSQSSGRWRWHGREFRELESLHPDIPKLDAWIKSGGWLKAVRSHRTKSAWQKRRSLV